MQPEVPYWLDLLRLALAGLALLGALAIPGLCVALCLFGVNKPDPITPQNAAHPTGGWWWLYPVVFILALLASVAYPPGFAS